MTQTAVRPSETTHASRPRVGISACLLGKEVRYDGGHKRDRFLTGTLAKYVEWIPMCPEAESGMGTPRPMIRLVGPDPLAPSVLETKTGIDRTAQLKGWVEKRAKTLPSLDLDGFILKKDSPSCGLARVRRYPSAEAKGAPFRDGSGLFALALKDRTLAVPLSEEGWLNDSRLREDFLSRLFTHYRLRLALETGSHQALLEAHAAHKFLYMAHHPKAPSTLGQLLNGSREVSVEQMGKEYMQAAMELMAKATTRGKHVNVLQHVLGFFKTVISAEEKQEMLALIADFRRATQPLAVPLALFRHYVNRYDVSDWLRSQVYFEPFPHAIAQRAARIR